MYAWCWYSYYNLLSKHYELIQNRYRYINNKLDATFHRFQPFLQINAIYVLCDLDSKVPVFLSYHTLTWFINGLTWNHKLKEWIPMSPQTTWRKAAWGQGTQMWRPQSGGSSPQLSCHCTGPALFLISTKKSQSYTQQMEKII